MSLIELNNLIGLAPRDAQLADSALSEIQQSGSDSFNDHLQWAQARTVGAAGSSSTATAAQTEKPLEPETRPDAKEPPLGPDRPADRQSDEESAGPARPTGAGADDPGEDHPAGTAPAETAAAETSAGDRPNGKTAATTRVSAGNQAETVPPGHKTRKEKTPRDAAGRREKKTQTAADPGPQSSRSSAGQQTVEQGTGEQAAAGKEATDSTASGRAPAHPDPKSGNDLRKIKPGKSGDNPGRPGQPLAAQPAVAEQSSTLARQPAGNVAASSPSTPGAQPSSGANHHVSDGPLVQGIGGAAEAATEPTSRGRQPKLPASPSQGPERPQRREKKEQPAAGHRDQPAPEQSLPYVDAAAATAPTPEAPTTAGAEIIAAVEPGAEVDADAAKPSSAETAGKQPSVPAREATGTEAPPSPPAPPPKANEFGGADPARFVERVARAFRSVGSRGGTIRLRLSPPELGSLRAEISVRGGVMTARLEVENQTTRNLLLDNLPALRDRLAQQDIKVERFQVDLMDHSSGGLPDHTADSPPWDSRRGNYDAPRAPAEPRDEAPRASDAGAARRSGEGSHLNVIV